MMSELPTIFEIPGKSHLNRDIRENDSCAILTGSVCEEGICMYGKCDKGDEASITTDFTDADDSDTMSCARSDQTLTKMPVTCLQVFSFGEVT